MNAIVLVMKFLSQCFYLSLVFPSCSAFVRGDDLESIVDPNRNEATHITHPSLLDVFYDNTAVKPIQKDEDKKLQIEGLTTWRSEYLYRGFRIAGSSQETQFAGQFAISDSESMDIGLFYGTATGSGDFSEYAGFFNYSKYIGDYRVSGKITFNEHDHSLFRSGVSADLGVAYQIDDQFALRSLVSYDTGARGLYSELKLEYYKEVDESSYFIFNTGVSVTGDYYDASGVHNIFSQLSYTFNVNESVSFTPYVMASLAINDEIEDSLLGGAYFSVNF